MPKIRRNDPCPCGSGKKYKHCCYHSDYQKIVAEKKEVQFSTAGGSKISRSVTSIDSIPTHNKNGMTPDITPEQMMDLCLDEIHKVLAKEKVGMLHDLIDKVVSDMDIVPTFTYCQISDRMISDGRFEVANHQICSLKGTDPVKLIAKKLKL